MTSYNENPNPYADGSDSTDNSSNPYGTSNPYSSSYNSNDQGDSQNSYGQNSYSQNQYGQNPYAQPQQPGTQSGANPYAGQNPYGQSPYQQTYQAYPMSSKSKIAAGLLGLFLGSLGVHNFYLGNTGKGVAQLLLTLVGWIIVIGPLIAGLWGFVEGIMILCSQYGSPWHRDANGYELHD